MCAEGRHSWQSALASPLRLGAITAQSSEAPPAYEIGHGRPPVHSRFKPGQSGNPKGRRKGARNKRTVVEQALNKRITIREDGRKRSLSKFEVLVLTMLNKALQGDVKTQIALFGLLRSFGMIGEEPEPTATEPVTAHDDEIIADFLRRQQSFDARMRAAPENETRRAHLPARRRSHEYQCSLRTIQEWLRQSFEKISTRSFKRYSRSSRRIGR